MAIPSYIIMRAGLHFVITKFSISVFYHGCNMYENVARIRYCCVPLRTDYKHGK